MQSSTNISNKMFFPMSCLGAIAGKPLHNSSAELGKNRASGSPHRRESISEKVDFTNAVNINRHYQKPVHFFPGVLLASLNIRAQLHSGH